MDIATALDVVFYDPCSVKQTLVTVPSFLDAAKGMTPALESLSDDERTWLIEIAQEHHLAFLFLRNSGKRHSHLQMTLAQSYTVGKDIYPTTRQDVLHVLDQYTTPTQSTISYGAASAQHLHKQMGMEAK